MKRSSQFLLFFIEPYLVNAIFLDICLVLKLTKMALLLYNIKSMAVWICTKNNAVVELNRHDIESVFRLNSRNRLSLPSETKILFYCKVLYLLETYFKYAIPLKRSLHDSLSNIFLLWSIFVKNKSSFLKISFFCFNFKCLLLLQVTYLW